MTTARMDSTAGGARTGIRLSGWGAFGGVTLGALGALNVINGFTAIDHGSYFKSHLIYTNLTFWGWVFLVWGVMQLIAAGMIFAHSATGYYLGVCLAGTAAILWFFMLFAAPLPAMVGVIVSLLVVYALTVGSQDSF
jgi:hypothetical protein